MTLGIPALSGCENGVVTQPRQSVLSGLVTGNAATNLNGDVFKLPAKTAGSDPEISEQQARILAQAWVATYASMLRADLERGHGGPVAVAELTPCGRSYYAQSPYEPMDHSVPDATRRAVAPWWLVGLCQQGQLAVSLAVSSLATDLTVVDGRIRLPNAGGGNEFFSIGVPATWDGPVQTTPEHAVIRAASSTKLRVSEVPDLFAPSPRSGPPQAAVWRIVLEAPATMVVAGSSATVATSVVYAGPIRHGKGTRATAGLLVAEAGPNYSVTKTAPPGSEGQPATLIAKSGVSLRLQPATVHGGN